MEDRSHLTHRVTADELHRMAAVGLIDPEARVELIEGAIIDMAPIGSPHACLVDRLARWLILAVGEQAIVRNQGPVRLNPWSEFVPDFALLKPLRHEYRARHPSGADTLLIIEVSDTTLRRDRDRKGPLYARHGVPELWIADVKKQTLHFFRGRTEAGYSDIRSVTRPGIVRLPGLGVDVDLTGLFRIGASRRSGATSG